MTEFGLASENFTGDNKGPRMGVVISDLALMNFETESRRMRIRALQMGVTVEQVQQQTGFELLVAEDLGHLPPPLPDELAIYRALRDGATASLPVSEADLVGSSAK